jgi:hypothetical protein
LLLVALGMLWAAFLNPTKKASPAESVRAFETDMDRLKSDLLSAPPHPTAGLRDRSAARLRARRRRLFTALVQAFAVTFLVGIMEIFRWMWALSGVLLLVTAVYVWLLLGYAAPHARPNRSRSKRSAQRPPVRRRPHFEDLSLDADDDVVVHREPRPKPRGA